MPDPLPVAPPRSFWADILPKHPVHPLPGWTWEVAERTRAETLLAPYELVQRFDDRLVFERRVGTGYAPRGVLELVTLAEGKLLANLGDRRTIVFKGVRGDGILAQVQTLTDTVAIGSRLGAFHRAFESAKAALGYSGVYAYEAEVLAHDLIAHLQAKADIFTEEDGLYGLLLDLEANLAAYGTYEAPEGTWDATDQHTVDGANFPHFAKILTLPDLAAFRAWGEATFRRSPAWAETFQVGNSAGRIAALLTMNGRYLLAERLRAHPTTALLVRVLDRVACDDLMQLRQELYDGGFDVEALAALGRVADPDVLFADALLHHARARLDAVPATGQTVPPTTPSAPP